MTSIWNKVEDNWPALVGSERVGFRRIRQEMKNFLTVRGIITHALSHYAIVVESIESSLEILGEFGGMRLKGLKKDWVSAYAVYVTRRTFRGKELEFIEPSGDSFFNTFLKREGERLHHVSFFVNNIQSCLERLKVDKVELIDREPRSGSHGKIVFIRPGLFSQMCIELCQKRE